jgi:GxxExxY protein
MDLDALTENVLNAVFEVSNTLGTGFLEKVYQRALLHEFKLRGIQATAETALPVTYKGQRVGDFFADLLVENVLVIELKCVERLAKEHFAQCLNYLRASHHTVCLLVNFQHSRVEFKRVVRHFDRSDPDKGIPDATPCE